jgi:signal transduction histidine kinase
MATETHLQNLADSARQLLDCDWTSLCLYCPDAMLRHPLLSLFFVLHPSLPLYYGSLPIYDEFLWILCDQAMLTGQCVIESAWPNQARGRQRTIRSVMIAMLECPSGVVGFLFCASQQVEAFREGEQRLLALYVPELAWQVEQIVSEGCLTTDNGGDSTIGVQEQSVFLSLISHELRAPLTAIKGYAALLHEYGAIEDEAIKISGEQQRRYLAVIMEQVKHLEVLMGDVLDVSHMQAGRLALRCAYVDLGRLCQRVVQFMQLRIDQQQPGQYCILCTIDQRLPLIWADADRVQQVLTNLVENALKYSPDGGLIEIQVRAASNCAHNCTGICHSDNYVNLEEAQSSHDAFICVAISDQGIGIPHQQQSSLFKPFTRLEHPATQHVSGTGLGLYIARKLVEAMHGRVVLRSKEGKGTTITFSLPVAHVPKTSARPHPAGLPLSQPMPTHSSF